ncbi:MAG: prepilin-type N-terminal cleavage/methylation domain-containing protein [Pseudomonadota bacterium]
MRYSQDRGFTLVEVLVGTSVLTLVLLATVTGLRTLASSQVALDRVAERNDELRSVSSFLRDALESVTLGRGNGGLSLGGLASGPTFFEVGGDYLLWGARVRIGEGTGGDYVLRVAQEDEQLVLRWQRQPPNEILNPWNNTQARSLVDNLEEFSVNYRREPDGPWKEEWDRLDTPGWVRLRVKQAGRFWPDLIVRLAG